VQISKENLLEACSFKLQISKENLLEALSFKLQISKENLEVERTECENIFLHLSVPRIGTCIS
jgi:hypothetical protein